jgi:hypothetical protein
MFRLSAVRCQTRPDNLECVVHMQYCYCLTNTFQWQWRAWVKIPNLLETCRKQSVSSHHLTITRDSKGNYFSWFSEFMPGRTGEVSVVSSKLRYHRGTASHTSRLCKIRVAAQFETRLFFTYKITQ